MAEIDFWMILAAVGFVVFSLWLVSLIEPKRQRYYPVAAVRLFAIAGSSWIGKLVTSEIQTPWLRWSAWLLVGAAIVILALWFEGLIRRHVQKANHAARR